VSAVESLSEALAITLDDATLRDGHLAAGTRGGDGARLTN
jgi:hypothetical protein